MPADTQQILDAAEKVGQMLKDHPAVERYRQAQRSLSEDTDAQRSLADFDRQLEMLARQEATGIPVTDAQRQHIEQLQGRIVSNIKVKALNLAQVEFIDLLRRVNQTILKHVQDSAPQTAQGAPVGAPPLSIGRPQ